MVPFAMTFDAGQVSHYVWGVHEHRPGPGLFRRPNLPSGQRLQFAIENGPFMVDLPMKIVIFHSYVCLPPATSKFGLSSSWQLASSFVVQVLV